MFLRRNKNPSTPPWLTWGVLAFVLLAVAMNFSGMRSQNGATVGANLGLPSLETYKMRLMPGYGRLQVEDLALGDGPAAVCGQEVDIRVAEAEAAPGQLLPKDIDPPHMEDRHFTLGDKNVPEALQEAVVGMRAGGRRTVLVPAERLPEVQKPMRYTIEMLEARPALPVEEGTEMPLRIFERKNGVAQEVRCGDTVRMRLAIWDLSGHELLNMHKGDVPPLEVTLGQSALMLGVEEGVLGTQADGARTLLVPPYLQRPLQAQDSAVQPPEILHNLTLPENQTILVDVDLVP